jgi:putative flippase GtrA
LTPVVDRPPRRRSAELAALASDGEEVWMRRCRETWSRLAYLLRTSEDRLFGRGARFAVVGCIVSAVYLSTTTVLASVVGMPFQIALVIGFCAGLVVHFTLQRTFVWVHNEGFALPFRGQMVRYLLAAGFQYGLTAASTSLLPPLLGLPTEVVYVVTVALATLLNFLVFRRLIFHAKPATSARR